MTAALLANSSSSTLTSTSSASPHADDAPACYYCSHLKLLREVIPPKRCDYVRGCFYLSVVLSKATTNQLTPVCICVCVSFAVPRVEVPVLHA